MSCLTTLTLLAGGVWAQEYRAKVQGTVTDPTQAAVTGAKVTLKNTNTGVENAQQTDSTGHFVFDFVQPGTYSLRVEAAGFQKLEQANIGVLTRADVTIDPKLTLGGVTETVTVTGEVAAVQFNTATMTTTVQGNMLRDIPVLARNPFTLALLNPAVINQYWDVAHRNPFYMWSSNGLNIGGATGGKNDMLLDGVSLGLSARGSYMPSMDAVQEVAVQQNALDSEFGFSAGGTLNVSMKSGTNDFHGTGYYFGRNPAFNAMTNRISRGKSVVKNHIWGGTVGGPILKNKLFFYQTYEQWKNTQPQTNFSTAPADLERSGNFSKSFAKDGSLRAVYDPYTTVFDPANNISSRTPFPGNIIPGNRINATGQKILNDLWKPNNAGDDLTGVNNVKVAYPWWLKYWNISTRADYNISEKMRMYARFSKYETRLDNPNWGNSIAVRSDNGGLMDALQPAIDFLWMLSPKTTINMRYGAVYLEDDYDSDWAKVKDSVWANLWPNGWYKPVIGALPGVYYPRFNFSGNGALSAGTGGWWLVRGRSHNSNLTLTHDAGKHHMKAGWQLRYQYDQNGSPGPGSFSFNAVDTGDNYLKFDASKSGNMYASALLGVVNSGNAAFNPMVDSHQQLWGFFFHDDIKLSRRVTLNVGLRYELETAPSEYNRMYSRTLDLTNPIPELQGNVVKMPSEVTSIYKGQFKYNGAWIYTDDGHPGVFNPQKTVLLPRIGAAFRINDLTSLRVGYARYSVPWITIYPETNGWPKDGYSRSTGALGPLQGVPRATIDNPFPSDNPLQLPVGKSLGRYMNLGQGATYFPQEMIHPINDRINVSLQRQMPFRIITDTTFFTNLGHNVQDASMWGGDYTWGTNQVDPNYAYTYKGAVDVLVPNPFFGLLGADKMPGALRTQRNVSVNSLLRVYPQYGGLTERFLRNKSSRYYSLQFKAEKSMSKGLTFTFGYNYSNEKRSEWFDPIATYNNRFTMTDTRQPRHHVRLAGTYELPFGKGRRFGGNANRLVDAVIGGWATSHIWMWNNGPLLTFGAMNASGDPTLANPTRGQYFDTSKFSQLQPYTPRTNPWYYPGLRGFGFWQWDATAVKYFPITERVKFELRMEFYNLPNSFIPNQPSLGVTSSTFGRSTGVAGGNYGREVQYTGRIHF
ncbi:MAG: carboxypeptidase regulatory-like domain-containing protein [Candidatus Solibacter usitatus]|nr:carboxypeptidase regulatory-like domain-containing protein [Candidatus Solibacter usitatus]